MNTRERHIRFIHVGKGEDKIMKVIVKYANGSREHIFGDGDKIICQYDDVEGRSLSIEPHGQVFGFDVYLSDQHGEKVKEQHPPDARITEFLEEHTDWVETRPGWDDHPHEWDAEKGEFIIES